MTDETIAPEPEAPADETPADPFPVRWVFYHLPGRVVSMSTRDTTQQIMTRFREAYLDDEVLCFDYPSGRAHAFPARQVISVNSRLLAAYENPDNPPPS